MLAFYLAVMSSQDAHDHPPRSGIRAALRARRSPSLHDIARRYDIHAISPRDMVALAGELYFSGFLNHDQYADLAFQAELMPNYDETIGALTGERAAPDRPRDYTKIWQAKLRFEMRHAGDDSRIVERARKILDLLRTIDKPETLPQVVEPPPARRTYTPPPAEVLDLPPLSLRAAPDERW